MPSSQTILGLPFFNGTPAEAVAAIAQDGGLLVAPSGTCFERFLKDADYRRALLTADLVLPDSGAMVTLWRLRGGPNLQRISGLTYLKTLLSVIDLGEVFWVLPHERAQIRLLAWLEEITNREMRAAKSPSSELSAPASLLPASGSALPTPRSQLPPPGSELSAPASPLPTPRSGLPAPSSALPPPNSAIRNPQSAIPPCYLAPIYGPSVEDPALLALIEARRPRHVIIGFGAGAQEKLGWYLREHASYRPAIHCIGGALGFVTGEQVAIPNWADRWYLGWFLRFLSQPRAFLPRLWQARVLPGLIFRYGRALPALVRRGEVGR